MDAEMAAIDAELHGLEEGDEEGSGAQSGQSFPSRTESGGLNLSTDLEDEKTEDGAEGK